MSVRALLRPTKVNGQPGLVGRACFVGTYCLASKGRSMCPEKSNAGNPTWHVYQTVAPAGCRALGSCFELTARILADGMFKRHAVVVML